MPFLFHIFEITKLSFLSINAVRMYTVLEVFLSTVTGSDVRTVLQDLCRSFQECGKVLGKLSRLI